MEPKTDLTQQFIDDAEWLIGQGVIKNYTDLAINLDWNPSTVSEVMGGKRSVPETRAKLFYERMEKFLRKKPKKTSREGIEQKTTFIKALLSQIFDQATAEEIAWIIHRDLIGLVSPSGELLKIVRAVERRQFLKANSSIEDLRHNFLEVLKCAAWLRESVLEVIETEGFIEIQSKLGNAEVVEEARRDIEYNNKLIKQYTSALSILLKSEIDVDNIDFFYIFDKFLKSEGEAISYISKGQPEQKDVNKVSLLFEGEFPNLIEDIHAFNPIPFFPLFEARDFRYNVDKPTKIVMKDYPFRLMVVPDVQHGDFAIMATGTILVENIKHGDILICKLVKKDDTWSNYRHGQTYILCCEHSEYPLVVCTVQDGKSNGTLQLLSDRSPEINPYVIEKSKVLGMWLIKAAVVKAPL